MLRDLTSCDEPSGLYYSSLALLRFPSNGWLSELYINHFIASACLNVQFFSPALMKVSKLAVGGLAEMSLSCVRYFTTPVQNQNTYYLH